jgi:hypothetical protein
MVYNGIKILHNAAKTLGLIRKSLQIAPGCPFAAICPIINCFLE